MYALAVFDILQGDAALHRSPGLRCMLGSFFALTSSKCCEKGVGLRYLPKREQQVIWHCNDCKPLLWLQNNPLSLDEIMDRTRRRARLTDASVQISTPLRDQLLMQTPPTSSGSFGLTHKHQAASFAHIKTKMDRN